MRSFELIPFGGVAAPDTICCDGFIGGSRLHLSHWVGNRTPARYRADTSVEIALRFNDDPDDAVAGWPVVNNHFDTDGALAVWTLCHPDDARRYVPTLIAAAEAGDFEEWNDNQGVLLDLAIRAMTHAHDDATAYAEVMKVLPRWLDDIEDAHSLWSAPWERLLAAEERVTTGGVGFIQHERILVVDHHDGGDALPALVINRRMPRDCTRILVCVEDAGRWSYRYVRPGWAWADTVGRPAVGLPGRNGLGARLGAAWVAEEDDTRESIVRTFEPVETTPTELVARLIELDEEARSAT